jgi:class 3 adenylate cyclase/tetratricopeptide (TPR) repeat protein
MSDIREWLEDLGLGEYVEAFEAEKIDLDTLPHLTEPMLKEVGLPVGPRAKILGAISALNSDGLEASPTEMRAHPDRPARSREAERRQITVMFCDLVGSTALSEQLDPEDLRALMQAYQQAAGGVIERYEGHVAQYLGDGLMTYFGWPQAHEDDAERSVRAGLEIVAAVKDVDAPAPLQVRIGIATGPVVVGETGDGDAAVPKLAVGETPNLAARLQGLAHADDVILGPSTRRLLSATFELDDLGDQALKGVVEPVEAFRVRSIAASEGRFEDRSHRLTHFVGRQAEMAMVMARWEQAKAGEGQVILLSGEPGIGKSRITQQLLETVTTELHTRLRYQCSPYHTHSALHPVIEQLERAAGFARDDTPEQKLDKLEPLFPDDGNAHALMASLLSLPVDRYPVLAMTSQKQKEETLQLLAEELLARASQQPVLLIFEDVHWIDPTTQELLDLFVPAVAGHEVLVIITYRPEYAPPWLGQGHVTPLALQRLGRSEAEAIVAHLSDIPLPSDILDQIVAKTDGVPLFVEELTKSVRESGAETAGAIPETLQDSLMARLDRLSQARVVAQTGACIGREFSYELLAAVSPLGENALRDALQQLADSELIFRRGTRSSATYTFKHALVRDTAYESLLKTKRQDLHGQIASVIEKDIQSLADAEPETVAYHSVNAADWHKAMIYSAKAANRASRGHSIDEALSLFEQGLAAGNHIAETEAADHLLTIHSGMSDLFFTVGDYTRARASQERALEIACRVGNREAESLALAGLAWVSTWAEDWNAAMSFAHKSVQVGEVVNAAPALASAHSTLGMIHALSGRSEPARKEINRSLIAARSVKDYVRESMARYITGAIENWEGSFDKASDISEAGVRSAQDHNIIWFLLRCQFVQTSSLVGKGDYQGALTLLNEATATAEKVGDEAFLPRFVNTLGWLSIECHDFDKGIELNERSAEFARQRHHATGVEMTAFCETNLGDAFLMKGDLTLAHEFYERVHRVVKDPATHDWMKWRYSTHLFASLGEYWLRRGQPAKAQKYVDQSLAIAVPTKSRKYLAKAWLLRGEIAKANRDWDEAQTWFRQALDTARTIGNPPSKWRAHMAMGRLHYEAERFDLAREEFRAARTVVDGIKSNVHDSELLSGLDGSEEIRLIYERAADSETK